MRDVDDLLRALDGPPPPPRAPDWPRPVRWPWIAVLALGATVLLAVGLSRDRPSARGVVSDGAVLDLRMVAERGGVAVRISDALHPGERVLFRASADRPAAGVLWVEGPTGRERIATVSLDAIPRDVGDASGLSGYRFDRPGRYVFHLTPTDGPCGDCPALTVEVR